MQDMSAQHDTVTAIPTVGPKPDLEMAFDCLTAKGRAYKRFLDYYDGVQPLMYTASRLEKVFEGVDSTFTQNWCSVVIDAADDRINLKSIKAKDADATTRLAEIWDDEMLALLADDIHLDALICGEAFIIAWKQRDAEGNEQLDLFRNDPSCVHIQYDADNPKMKKWAAKFFTGDDGRGRITLYYRDRVEFYVVRESSAEVNSWKAYVKEKDDAPNPFDEIPVFHFTTSGRRIQSELANVIPIQNAINKMVADMMIAAEFGAFKQRYVISNADNLGALRNAPNEIWTFPAGDGLGQATQVGEFQETNLQQFLDAIDKLALSLSATTRTPKHFFFSQSGEPSGEALMTMEAPLVEKCRKFIARFAPTWKEIAAFLLKLDGKEVSPKTIEPVFDDPRSVLPVARAGVRKQAVEAGIPLETQLRDEEGWSEERLSKMRADKKREAEENRASLGEALINAQKNFDRGGNNEQEQQKGG